MFHINVNLIISYFSSEKKKRKKKMTKELDYDDESREAWTSKVAPSKECHVNSSQLDLEMEVVIGDKPREAWTLGQPYWTKSSLMSKLSIHRRDNLTPFLYSDR